MFTVSLLLKSQISGSTPGASAAANAAGAGAATAAAAADAAGGLLLRTPLEEGSCCYFFCDQKNQIKICAHKYMFGVWGVGGGCYGIVGENGGWRVRGLIPLRLTVPTLNISKSQFKMSLVKKYRMY